MLTDVLPETQRDLIPSSESAPNRSDPPTTSSTRKNGRWWKRGLIVIGLLVVSAGAFAMFSGKLFPKKQKKLMTHTIGRSDLTVSVIEQGTLESSNNVEIKCKVRGFSTVISVVEGGTEVKPGDELVRLDTKVIEENLSLTKTNTHIARATLERTKADVATAEIAIDAYLKGRYRTQLKSLERERENAEANLLTAQELLDQSRLLYARGYVNDLELEASVFAVRQAKLELKVKTTEIDVLENYTRKMELETLNGNLTATKSKLQADEAGLKMDDTRRLRALEELENCVIKADRAGLVIYPSAAAWKDTPDVVEGASVRHDQVLLLMPDLSKMQVKVGIHESIIDRVKTGLTAQVSLPDRTLKAEVSTVATVTRPAGWWTGNVVKYDTIINIPEEDGLKPGMSAEVEIILAEHKNVLTIPVAAIVEIDELNYCWVETESGPQRRRITLGDSNDVFIVVKSGLKEGDEVVLNPLAFIEEAQDEIEGAIVDEDEAVEATEDVDSGEASDATASSDGKESGDGN